MRILLILVAAGVLTQLHPPRSSIIEIAVTDAAGKTHTVSVGAHSAATDTMDYVLGELPVPPPPFEGVFDVRLLDAPGHHRRSVTGSYTDLRRLTSPGQIDTFRLGFHTSPDAYPMRFLFTGDFARLCDSIAVIIERGSALERIVLKNGEWSVSGADVHSALIIRHGVKAQ